MEIQSKRDSDLQALYAIRDEIIEIERLNESKSSIFSNMKSQQSLLSRHNVPSIQKDKNIIAFQEHKNKTRRKKYIVGCCVILSLYFALCIATGIFAWLQMWPLVLEQAVFKMAIVILSCYELLLAIIATIVAIICCSMKTA